MDIRNSVCGNDSSRLAILFQNYHKTRSCTLFQNKKSLTKLLYTYQIPEYDHQCTPILCYFIPTNIAKSTLARAALYISRKNLCGCQKLTNKTYIFLFTKGTCASRNIVSDHFQIQKNYCYNYDMFLFYITTC